MGTFVSNWRFFISCQARDITMNEAFLYTHNEFSYSLLYVVIKGRLLLEGKKKRFLLKRQKGEVILQKNKSLLFFDKNTKDYFLRGRKNYFLQLVVFFNALHFQFFTLRCIITRELLYPFEHRYMPWKKGFFSRKTVQ